MRQSQIHNPESPQLRRQRGLWEERCARVRQVRSSVGRGSLMLALPVWSACRSVPGDRWPENKCSQYLRTRGNEKIKGWEGGNCWQAEVFIVATE